MHAKRHSVLLLYPGHSQETYLSHVVADGVDDAILQAQKQAVYDNPDAGFSPEDFLPLLVCERWIEDLRK